MVYARCRARVCTCTVFSGGIVFIRKRGVTQDNVLALMWLKLSILDSSGNMKAFREGMKNDLESMMLPEQITETENMVQEWPIKQ